VALELQHQTNVPTTLYLLSDPWGTAHLQFRTRSRNFSGLQETDKGCHQIKLVKLVKGLGEDRDAHSIPLMFQTLIDPSLDAVMMPSESHVKHSHVTALCNLRANNQQ
jgi:hypothetical protein